MEKETTENLVLPRLCPECTNALLKIDGVTTVNINVPSDAGDNYVPMEIADSWYCARCTWHERFDGKEPDTSWLKEKSDGQRKQRETHEQAESKPDSPDLPFPDPLKALGEGLQAIGNMGMQALNMAQATMDETVRQGQELNRRMEQVLETIAPILPRPPQPVDPEPDMTDFGFTPKEPPKTPPTAPIFGGESEEE